jgi:nitroreductase
MSDVPTEARQALLEAAGAARYAPSIHNTQPWRWVVHPDRLELYAATERQLQRQDPDAHMLLLSCGTALHHARTALDAGGWQYQVDRPAAGPLAAIHPGRQTAADPAAARRFALIPARHTDRRTVTDQPVEGTDLDDLVRVVEQQRCGLHLLSRDQVIGLAVAMERAQVAQAADERLREETSAWVGGDRASGAGVPDAAIPENAPLTTVAERDFGVAGTLAAGTGHDTAATYAVLYGPDDAPADWLRAGEALSGLWLTATERGINVLPQSSPVEVDFTRAELHRLLSGVGLPYLVLRLGTLGPARPGPARTPRLPVEQVVEVRD